MPKTGAPIQDTNGLLKTLSQHPILPVIVAASYKPFDGPKNRNPVSHAPRRLSANLFFFMIRGETRHNVDMRQIDLRDGQVLFIQPNQIYESLSDWSQDSIWYKIAFDEKSLGLLPRSFDFLLDPLHHPVIDLDPAAQERLTHAFGSLMQLLSAPEPSTIELILAWLHVLLSEMDTGYFKQQSEARQPGDALEIYLNFKRLVEREFSNQPPIQQLAATLAVSENRLYTVIRQFTGVSPKTYMLNRTMLEAQRLFYYDRPSVKEAAYELGFSDPDHFSRVFKRTVGKTVTKFIQDLSS
jgi:AraC family transcriptional regulator, transcriptional activator of pobA